MAALLCVVAAALSFYVVLYYIVFRGARCYSSAKLEGKTAIVTGNRPHLPAAANPLASLSLPASSTGLPPQCVSGSSVLHPPPVVGYSNKKYIQTLE